MMRLVLPTLLLLLEGCVCVADPTGHTWSCQRDSDCTDGFVCAQQVCTPLSTVCDCSRSDCDAHPCDGGTCQAGVCACVAAGGAPQSPETSCHDGHDNDCDTLVDCDDPDCAEACAVTDAGVDAGLPDAGPRDAGTPDAGVPETNCADNLDNDGDHVTDCADPDCQGRTCLGNGTPVCCGGSCVDTSLSKAHCGGCDLACTSPSVCLNVGASGHITGVCSCAGTSCPGSQTCAFNSCRCSGPQDCAPGEVCDSISFACRYP